MDSKITGITEHSLIHINNKLNLAKIVFKSLGKYPCYSLNTKEGYSLQCSEDQLIQVNIFDIDYWIPISQLKIGMSLNLNCKSIILPEFESSEEFNRGYLIGNVFGDGCVYITKNNTYARISVDETQLNYINTILPNANFSTRHNFHCISCDDNRITELIRTYRITKDKEINDNLILESPTFIKGFLSGFFDCDSSVSIRTRNIVLAQTDTRRIIVIQQLLSLFGIRSSISKHNYLGIRKIDNRVINSKEINHLVINNKSAWRFHDLIGYKLIHKQQKLYSLLSTIQKRKENKTATIKEIKRIDDQELFSPNLEISYIVNGLILKFNRTQDSKIN